MKEPDWNHFYNSSVDRMRRLIEAKAPKVIIANEARSLLRTAEHGVWKAIGRWAWNELYRKASNMRFDVRVFLHATLSGIGWEAAIDKVLDIDERREEKRWKKKGETK